mmetsp:Transcript_63409/g.183704  ORF Transcript_63409/g.183704 Transcript_63409/m.183704 type:complete len:351 (+) Transcript_63409:233-1285(+)
MLHVAAIAQEPPAARFAATPLVPVLEHTGQAAALCVCSASQAGTSFAPELQELARLQVVAAVESDHYLRRVRARRTYAHTLRLRAEALARADRLVAALERRGFAPPMRPCGLRGRPPAVVARLHHKLEEGVPCPRRHWRRPELHPCICGAQGDARHAGRMRGARRNENLVAVRLLQHEGHARGLFRLGRRCPLAEIHCLHLLGHELHHKKLVAARDEILRPHVARDDVSRGTLRPDRVVGRHGRGRAVGQSDVDPKRLPRDDASLGDCDEPGAPPDAVVTQDPLARGHIAHALRQHGALHPNLGVSGDAIAVRTAAAAASGLQPSDQARRRALRGRRRTMGRLHLRVRRL